MPFISVTVDAESVAEFRATLKEMLAEGSGQTIVVAAADTYSFPDGTTVTVPAEPASEMEVLPVTAATVDADGEMTVTVEEPQKKRRGRKAATEKPEAQPQAAQNDPPRAQAAGDEGASPASEASQLTYDAVRTKLHAFAEKHGQAGLMKITEIVKSHGYAKVRDLQDKSDDYAAILADTEAADKEFSE